MPPTEPFESASELREAHGKLLEALDDQLDTAESEAAALREIAPRVQSFLERGQATGLFLEEVKERTACQVLLDYWVSSLSQAGIATASARLAPFDRDRLPDLRDKPCPYVGLEAFRDRDAPYFFGRETDVQTLLAQLAETPLLVVLGASGSGKSSLVLGGALPAIRGLQVVPPFVPGNAVLQHLADSVLRFRGAAGSAADEAVRLRQDPSRLAALAGDTPALLTIDQFEEVFTLSEPDREALAANLAGFLQAGRGHRAILTMREEFRSRMVELRPLGEMLAAAWYSMRPMGYEELKAAVERPAALVNLQFQSGIVDDLVKKVLGQPAALPLLQFTLRALWEKRDRNRITWEVYRKVGDPLNALKASADRFYESLPPEAQTEVRRILLALVRVDELLEAYRQPVPESQLLEAGRANTREVLALLAAHDYVRVSPDGPGGPGGQGGEAVVEVKHESLVRNWPRLVDWIDEKRRGRRLRVALSEAAKRWREQGEGLLTGWQLEDAKQQVDLSGLEAAFVQASAQAADAEQRKQEVALRREAARERKLRNRALVALVMALATALGIAAAARYFWTRAAQLEAEKQQLEKAQQVLQADYRKLSDSYAKLDQGLAERIQKGVETARSLSPSRPVTLFLHISQEWQRPRAQEIARQLQQQGIVVPGIEKVKPVQHSSVRYFHDEDLAGARQIAELLGEYLSGQVLSQPTRIGGYEDRVPPGRYEIWFSSDALGAPPVAPLLRSLKLR